jgi:hypothetical protein
MIPQEYITIHHALFSEQYVVTINNIDYPIQKNSIGTRYVDYQGIRISQQSKYGISEWAQKARAGQKISWARDVSMDVTGLGHYNSLRIDDETINSTKNQKK